MKGVASRFGVTLPTGINPSLKNAAAVMVTAELPVFAKPASVLMYGFGAGQGKVLARRHAVDGAAARCGRSDLRDGAGAISRSGVLASMRQMVPRCRSTSLRRGVSPVVLRSNVASMRVSHSLRSSSSISPRLTSRRFVVLLMRSTRRWGTPVATCDRRRYRRHRCARWRRGSNRADEPHREPSGRRRRCPCENSY